jgi:hypothetical protein
MAKIIPPTKKNSPAIKVGKNPDNLPADSYAKESEKLNMADLGGGAFDYSDVKTEGVAQRGHGAAVKGFTSRGPLA